MSELPKSLTTTADEKDRNNVSENNNGLILPETEEEEERELPEWMLRKLKARKGEGSSLTIIESSKSNTASNDGQSTKVNENINKQNKDTLESTDETSQPTSINEEDFQHSNDNSGTSIALAVSEDETSVSPTQHSQQANDNSGSSTMLATAEEEACVSPTQQKRVPCKYGEQCYRRNPAHKEEFSHPGDEDYSSEQDEAQPSTSADSPDLRPECEYGTSCYRQNPQHKRDFKHTQPPTQSAATADSPKAKKTRNKPAKRKRKTDDDDYESEGDNEYDLNDSFLEDSAEEEEEEKEDEEDDDYVPDKEDPELLDENQWKETDEDGPEVLELLKEARDYLRNKKMHK